MFRHSVCVPVLFGGVLIDYLFFCLNIGDLSLIEFPSNSPSPCLIKCIKKCTAESKERWPCEFDNVQGEGTKDRF